MFLFFAGCKKDDTLEASKVELKNNKIEKGWDYLKISAEYEYPEELVSINLCLSEKEDMSGAKTYKCDIEGKTFSVEVDELKDGTKYYYQFEYDNGCWKEKSKKENVATYAKPVVITNEVTNKTPTSATLNGNVICPETENKITVKGFCWGTEPGLTTEGTHTNNGTEIGTYSFNLSNLTPNTAYYVRAYATNKLGTAYGEEISFTTLEETNEIYPPTVTTAAVTEIGQTAALSGGNVTSDGGADVTARGVCWSTSQNPTIDDNKTENGSGTGSYVSNLSNLTPNTIYYVRAYATNSAGTGYGDERSFTTLENVELPTLTTTNVTNITETTATCGGNVTSDGGADVTARGVCWSTSQNPTINNNHTTDGTGTGSYNSNLSNLTPNTTYYVRAYATNSAGTGYGEERSFTTLEEVPFETQTITVNSVSFTMIAVEGGTFQMGATSEQGGDADSDEKPVHSVTLSDYYIGETEVTQELWEAVMVSNPSYFSGSQRPVERVSWNDCQEFITQLNQLTGKNFRLPTEAEWEYAARGGSKSKGYKYSGSNTIGNVAWYDVNSIYQTHNVKTKSPNELGIYDMSGNVYEWCQDWYGSYSSGSQTNPTGPSSGSDRVCRGGSVGSGAGSCRVSNRGYGNPDDGNLILGLRLCLPQ